MVWFVPSCTVLVSVSLPVSQSVRVVVSLLDLFANSEGGAWLRSRGDVTSHGWSCGESEASHVSPELEGSIGLPHCLCTLCYYFQYCIKTFSNNLKYMMYSSLYMCVLKFN